MGINKSSYFEPLRCGVASVVTLLKWDIHQLKPNIIQKLIGEIKMKCDIYQPSNPAAQRAYMYLALTSYHRHRKLFRDPCPIERGTP
jgi:hypothetical protein